MKRPKRNLDEPIQSDSFTNTPCTPLLTSRSLRAEAIAGDLAQLAQQVATSEDLQLQLGQEVKACRAEIQRALDAKTLSSSRGPGASQLLELNARVACEVARMAVNAILT